MRLIETLVYHYCAAILQSKLANTNTEDCDVRTVFCLFLGNVVLQREHLYVDWEIKPCLAQANIPTAVFYWAGTIHMSVQNVKHQEGFCRTQSQSTKWLQSMFATFCHHDAGQSLLSLYRISSIWAVTRLWTWPAIGCYHTPWLWPCILAEFWLNQRRWSWHSHASAVHTCVWQITALHMLQALPRAVQSYDCQVTALHVLQKWLLQVVEPATQLHPCWLGNMTSPLRLLWWGPPRVRDELALQSYKTHTQLCVRSAARRDTYQEWTPNAL